MAEAQAIGVRPDLSQTTETQLEGCPAVSDGRRIVAPRLYALADADTLGADNVATAVSAIADAGISWIQLRAKNLNDLELFRLVETCCRQLDGSGVSLWIDDRPDLAALFPVYGVHLGQHDLPPAAARRILDPKIVIGSSTHNLDQVVDADNDPAVDVVALGPIFSTTGKRDPDPVVGLDMLKKARALTAKPLVVIGGIEASTLAAVFEAGADCAALLGAVCRGDIAINCRRLRLAAGEAL